MNSTEPNNKPFYERPIIVIPAIFAFILCLVVLNRIITHGGFGNTDYSDTSGTTTEDSIQTTHGLIPESTFDSQYSAESWYSEFSSNKVAFEQKYQDTTIDINGAISDIKEEYGCSIVVMRGGRTGFDVLEFSNCPDNHDKWLKEVTKLQVGDVVHIRGKFEGTTLYDGMEMYGCHVITP